MNKYLYICILFFSLCCVGCFEDDSSLEIKNLNPIRIENITLDGSYAIYQGDTLEIEPLVFCEGVPDADLSFEWQLSGGTIVPTILDSTMYMSAAIQAPPSASAYLLKLTVTDNTTGIARIEKFNVNVQSPYEAGLLVADTKDTGQTSDLSLIRAREFDVNIPQDNDEKRVFRNLWAQSNGTPMEGTILDCIANSSGRMGRTLTILTTEHLLRADFYDYVNIADEADGNMFVVTPPHIGNGYTHGCFGEEKKSRNEELLSANGLLTARAINDGQRLYNYTVYPTGVLDYDVTMMYNPEWCPVYCYDALGKQMLFYKGGSLWKADEQLSGPFDVNDLSDYEPFLLSKIQSGIALLAKQKSTGAFVALVMNELQENGSNFAKTKFDFSAAPNIDGAKFFDVNELEDVVYYANETQVYAAPMANPAVAQLQYELPFGSTEKITAIKVYDFETGGKCMYEDVTSEGRKQEMFLNSAHHMMMIITYDETTREGKIRCIPIKTLGLGGLEKNTTYHVTFSGFNQITGVYCQVGRGVIQ